jgi:hypothetical protein
MFELTIKTDSSYNVSTLSELAQIINDTENVIIDPTRLLQFIYELQEAIETKGIEMYLSPPVDEHEKYNAMQWLGVAEACDDIANTIRGKISV